jgi:steroid delta-isomerase-like uncharacterized protein
MTTEIREVTTEVLEAFADAWNRHDADAIMAFMTEDCVFEASAGPDVCGTRYAGRDAVRAGFAEVWATFPDAHWGNARHIVCGARGVSEWTFTGTRSDGTRVEVHGCDLFTFRDGKIALKNSYRKNRPPMAPPAYASNRFQKGIPDMPTKNCEASIRYYVDVLGFTKDFDDAILGRDRRMFAGVSRGECALTLNEHDAADRSPGLMSCHVDDVDLLHDEYRSRGVKVTSPPEDKPWSARGFSIEDSEGNELHFSSPLRK